MIAHPSSSFSPHLTYFHPRHLSGPHTVSSPVAFSWGSCGRVMPGAEIKLIPDPPHGDEICFRGRNIMMGYMGDPAKTAGAIDADGWLHSGDVGTMDEFGMIRITGRIKELLITRGGENIGKVSNSIIIFFSGWMHILNHMIHVQRDYYSITGWMHVLNHMAHHLTSHYSPRPCGRYNQVVTSWR